MKNTIRKLSAIAVICALCLCLLTGCGSETPDTDTTTTLSDETTTTADDETTTTADDETATTDSTAISDSTTTEKVGTSVSEKPSQEGTSTTDSTKSTTSKKTNATVTKKPSKGNTTTTTTKSTTSKKTNASVTQKPSKGNTTTTTSKKTTTTVTKKPSKGNTTTTTKATTSKKTNTQASSKPSTTTTTKSTMKVPDPIAFVSDIQVGGATLDGFNSSTMTYVHYLPTGTTVVPKVTATKTVGTGDMTITQATSVNGTAKVSLNDVTYTIQFVVKRAEGDILNNTYYQLKKANKLNIAYLGGSVTDGFSFDSSKTDDDPWRAQTTNWFKSQYPNATITETNAGIGGTGSMYGAYRVIQDLKLQSPTEKPDLVFVEFASNDQSDAYVNTTPDMYMESIIRTIYQYAPQADIVMVFITSYNTKDTEFASKAAHKKIADIYQIPCIDVGARLWKEMVAENGGTAPVFKARGDAANSPVWDKYFSDSVHPAKAGYAKYAQYVREYLEGVLSKKSAAPASLKNAPMPSAAFTELPVAPYIANFKGMTLSSNFTVSANGHVITKKGGTFTIKFTGTELYAWIYGQAATEDAAGCLKVRVDGGKRQTLSLAGSNHKILPLATGLSNGEHTIEIRVTSTSSAGKVDLDFWYFLISGDTQMRGITLA